MDSLTQITLGAAVGEAVLGKKIGNRALLWGAIGGTIPDLDVLANNFLNDVEAIAFHRGPSHSLLFACIVPLLLGPLVHWFYASDIHKKETFKVSAMALWFALIGLIGFGINYIPVEFGGNVNLILVLVTLIIIGSLVYVLWNNYYKAPLQTVKASRADWIWLLFWAIFTHPLLDCFTTYGTQLFLPFSDYRVVFSTISVVDPIYTVPFIICLIIVGKLRRDDRRRRIVNYIGIGLSSAYLLFTVFTKWKFDTIFEKSLADKGIQYENYLTSPTIFNNILWQGIAKSDTVYYHALYSFLDTSPTIQKFTPIPANHELADAYKESRTIEVFQWFTDGYYNIIKRDDGQLQLNDIRFGFMEERTPTQEDFVFRFVIKEDISGQLVAKQEGRKPVEGGFQLLFNRIKGK